MAVSSSRGPFFSGTAGALVAGVLLAAGGAIGAARWNVAVAAPSRAQARATTPVAPTGVTAKCLRSTGGTGTSSTTPDVKVSWAAATHATGYTVWESKTSGPYAAVARVTATSWSSGTLTAGAYVFEVSTDIGTRWSSTRSGTSATATIKQGNGRCSA